MPAWTPDSDDLLVYSRFESATKAAWKAAFGIPAADPVYRALRPLTTRCCNTWISLSQLITRSDHDVLLDCATLLRASFEAYLQAAWICASPQTIRERAELFVDFCWVEHYQLSQRMLAMDNALGSRLAKSLDREKTEKTIQEELDRVRNKYADSHGRLRKTWYQGSLFDLAHALSLEDEYQVFVFRFHSSVHSNPMALIRGTAIRGPEVVFLGGMVAARALLSSASALDVELAVDDRRLLQTAASADFLNPRDESGLTG